MCWIKWWFIRLPCLPIGYIIYDTMHICHNSTLVYLWFAGLLLVNTVSQDPRCNWRQRLWQFNETNVGWTKKIVSLPVAYTNLSQFPKWNCIIRSQDVCNRLVIKSQRYLFIGQNAHHKLIRRIRSRMDQLNAWLQFQNLKIHWIKQLYHFMKSIEKF